MKMITQFICVSYLFCVFSATDGESLPNLCTAGTSITTVPVGVFNCSVPRNTNRTLRLNVNRTTSAVMIQFHTLQETVQLAENGPSREIARGFHAGLLRYTGKYETSLTWSVQTFSVNNTVNVLFRVTAYTAKDPVPGACNKEFTPENEPNLHFKGSNTSDLATVVFADGNVGCGKGDEPPACDKSHSLALKLEYHMYIYYMPTKDYTSETMLEAVQKMMTPDGVRKYGQKVVALAELNPKKIYLALFKNRGSVYNVLVHDPLKNTSSTYIPYVNYACDQKTNGTVCTYTDMGPTMVYTFCGLLGTILCFLGHWTFLYEMFMFGFLPAAVGVYMLLAANIHHLLIYGIMTGSVTVGLIAGLSLMMLWWRFGKVTPTVLWISLILGFHLSSVLFFTPFGYMSIWHDSTVFGLAFACAILIAPIFGLLFQKWVSVVACAMIGSYMMISTLSFFFGGILHYITQNVVHRATQDNFDKAIYILPGNPVDYVLASLWCLFFSSGVASQAYMTWQQKDFPECPYKGFMERRRMLRWGSRRGDTSSMLVSGTINPSDSEHAPLVGDL